MNAVLDDIRAERNRQDAKWGTVEQNPHTGPEWLDILAEEFNEVAMEVHNANRPRWREELIHLAAVAVAAVEQYDLQKTEEGK